MQTIGDVVTVYENDTGRTSGLVAETLCAIDRSNGTYGTLALLSDRLALL